MTIKDYIGDGVYAEWDGYSVILTSENGVSVLDRIVLSHHELENINRFYKRMTQNPAVVAPS